MQQMDERQMFTTGSSSSHIIAALKWYRGRCFVFSQQSWNGKKMDCTFGKLAWLSNRILPGKSAAVCKNAFKGKENTSSSMDEMSSFVNCQVFFAFYPLFS